MLPLLVTPPRGSRLVASTADHTPLLFDAIHIDRRMDIGSRACQRRNEEKSETVVVVCRMSLWGHKKREKRIWGMKETLAPLRGQEAEVLETLLCLS